MHRFLEPGQVLLHHVIFALTLMELHHRNLLLFGEALHGCYEGFGHLIHQGGGGELVAAVETKEFRDSTFTLQHRHVDIEVHAIDAIQLESHMMIEDVGNALWYAHFGSGTTPILRDRLPPRRPTHGQELLAVPHRRPEPSLGLCAILTHDGNTPRRSEAEPR